MSPEMFRNLKPGDRVVVRMLGGVREIQVTFATVYDRAGSSGTSRALLLDEERVWAHSCDGSMPKNRGWWLTPYNREFFKKVTLHDEIQRIWDGALT